MNNHTVENILLDCDNEIAIIQAAISQSPLSSTNMYLTRYALIKACSAIERGYKRIVADYYIAKCIDLSPYLEKKVVNSSTNPTYESICTLVRDFNSQTESLFKTSVQSLTNYNQVVAQLHSLVTNRNNFAHGQTVSCSLMDIVDYYNCAKSVLVCLDSVVC